MTQPAAVEILASAAPAYGITPLPSTNSCLRAAVPVLLTDGSLHGYELEVQERGGRPCVREVTRGARLPAFCPMRHINADGSFCLNWEPYESLALEATADGATWWGAVLQFLRLQERARRLRRWPNRREWAHGDAAVHQRKALEAAAAVSPRLFDRLFQGRVAAVRSKGCSSRGNSVRLQVDGRAMARVFVKQRRPATLRQACPCGQDERPLTLRRCRDHADRLVEIIGAMQDMATAERAFWKSFEGKPCCGTINGCPLGVAGP